MKEFEILQELPKHDTEAQSEQMLEKWHQQTCLAQNCHEPPNSLKKKKKLDLQSTIKKRATKHYMPVFCSSTEYQVKVKVQY